MANKQFDCIVCGSCVVDLLCRPVQLDKPITGGVLHSVDPIVLAAGGICSNSGITLARLGMNVGVFTYLGADSWAPVVRDLYRKEGIDASPIVEHPTGATSTTVVLIDSTGERSFMHCVGAPRELNAKSYLDQLDLFARSRMMLMGYYSLMPNLEADLPRVLKAIREVGCQTALDAAGAGGGMHPLAESLPYLDIYVPSLSEASHQTGLTDPHKIIDVYRQCGAPGLLGVKLGSRGVLLSPRAGEFMQIPIVSPPGPVIDTTGAGDSFYAGLLTGLLKGLPTDQAGRLGAAAAACCITTLGGCSGGRDYEFTAQLAGIVQSASH